MVGCGVLLGFDPLVVGIFTDVGRLVGACVLMGVRVGVRGMRVNVAVALPGVRVGVAVNEKKSVKLTVGTSSASPTTWTILSEIQACSLPSSCIKYQI